MNTLTQLLAALRRVLGRGVRPSFAQLLDEAVREPFVTFSARALELANLDEHRANPNEEERNPKQSAYAGAND